MFVLFRFSKSRALAVEVCARESNKKARFASA